ncbi:MAG TPA: hypothetical protein VGL77_00980 [Armatimonadota bacterium]|jgi:dienelactone hydrolase
MKQFLVLGILTLAALGWTMPTWGEASPAADITTLLAQSFDKQQPGDTPEGWTVTWGEQGDDMLTISNQRAASKPNCLLLDRKTGTNTKAWQCAHMLPAVADGVAVLSFAFLVQGAGNDAVFEIECRPSPGERGASIQIANRKVSAFFRTGGKSCTLGECLEDRWYRVELRLPTKGGQQHSAAFTLQAQTDAGKWETVDGTKTLTMTPPQGQYGMLLLHAVQDKRNSQLFFDDLRFGQVTVKTDVAPPPADRASLFAVPDFAALPPDVRIIAEKTADGIITSELTFAGAPFNGKPTRIYGFYARPAQPGKYPGVVQLHGAGLVTLAATGAEFYAKHGYACLSIDWAGPTAKRIGTTSEFTSAGNLASAPPALEDGTPSKAPWKSTPPEVNGITNGVRFVLRSFMFLRSRPEVDSNKLCLSGMSAGAHLSLLVLGQDPTIKAAAVKYGEAFIRDMPGYFGGYFGPITLAPKAEQDVWLAALDPKYDLPKYRASVMLLSGTDDIYFMMPVVLKTYREIRTPKVLVMNPNDNHTQVGNEALPFRYFQAVLGSAPAFPSVTPITMTPEDTSVRLATTVIAPSPLAKVTYVIKRMAKVGFTYKSNWQRVAAVERAGTWETVIPAVTPDEQLLAYVLVEDTTGAIAASDTIELPTYPRWRGE